MQNEIIIVGIRNGYVDVIRTAGKYNRVNLLYSDFCERHPKLTWDCFVRFHNNDPIFVEDGLYEDGLCNYSFDQTIYNLITVENFISQWEGFKSIFDLT